MLVCSFVKADARKPSRHMAMHLRRAKRLLAKALFSRRTNEAVDLLKAMAREPVLTKGCCR